MMEDNNMQEIRCPKCGETFKVDESGYAQIVQQVRDKEFTNELDKREKELLASKENELQLIQIKEATKRQEELDARDKQIAQLLSELETKDVKSQLAVSEAVRAKEAELSNKETEISKKEIELAGLKNAYETELKLKDEQIEYYKDFKARQSTKMIGESLETHCQTQFNLIRATAFPNAYFEKDNDIRTGSKGDFIFREKSDDGVEFISIMFEMKNEMDTTSTKHKNEHFFAELDKDRKEKSCEYAVLVTMLETDSELYNSGIVDVSHKYPKMYVIRPNFFIPMITLLRNAALKSLDYQRELAEIRNREIDISNFEDNINEFKSSFGRNYRLASERFGKAIEEIDKSIDHLQKIKENLIKSDDNLRLANSKAEDLSVKKLTKNCPTVKEMFDAKK